MLSIQQAYGVLTSAYTTMYQEMIPAPSFLKTFFKVETNRKATVKLEVQRGTEYMAVDVLRGSRGNRNQSSVWSQKEYLPPFYKEYFDATQLDNYDRVFGQNPDVSDAEVIASMSRDIASEYIKLRDKCERRKELQAAQVFDNGVVTMINGDNINFARKATSMVNLTGAYWTTAATDIESQLIAGAEFCRRTGKNGTPQFDIIMSGTAWVNLKKSTYFTTLANFNQVSLIDIKRPQTTAFGASYHGQITAGAYLFNVWTYDEVYQNESGTITRYWPEKKVVIIPTAGTQFKLSHGGLPMVMKAPGNAEFSETINNVAGEYARYNLIDANASAHYFYLMTACVAIPVTVDMIYTMQVIA